jgi:2-oxoisovalerate dehydrogenase E1 component
VLIGSSRSLKWCQREQFTDRRVELARDAQREREAGAVFAALEISDGLVVDGDRVTVVSWGAMVHRCRDAATRFDGDVHLIDLRTIAPWDRDAVLESVRRTGKCLIVHEDTSTAGFGAEISAVLAREAFWHLDAPIERLAVEDVPMPYHPGLMDAVLPDADRIAERIAWLLST